MSKMIHREDTFKQRALINERGTHTLPHPLQENTMRADNLLFKEAQVNYLTRRKQMMK